MDAATEAIDSSSGAARATGAVPAGTGRNGVAAGPARGGSSGGESVASDAASFVHGGERPGRARSRRLLSVFFIAAGVNHFANRRAYEAIVPPSLAGDARTVVDISGVAEIVGGVGVLVPATRRLAGLWLIAVLAAVFPANIYMARTPERFKKLPRWALLARLPLQPAMMVWAWRATRG